jgi:hypothetical protein
VKEGITKAILRMGGTDGGGAGVTLLFVDKLSSILVANNIGGGEGELLMMLPLLVLLAVVVVLEPIFAFDIDVVSTTTLVAGFGVIVE